MENRPEDISTEDGLESEVPDESAVASGVDGAQESDDVAEEASSEDASGDVSSEEPVAEAAESDHEEATPEEEKPEEEQPEEKKKSAPKKVKAETAPQPGEGEFGWYVVRVQSGREDSIANNLRKKLALTKMDHMVEDVVVPKQSVTEIKEGKKRTKKQKLYPGYIFVQANLEDDLWYLIRDTNGIGDFVGSTRRPVPMADAEVRKIMDIMEEKEEAPQVQIDLKRNDTVKIVEGPFENFDGVVEEVNPTKGLVRVMVTIFGRSTPVDLEYWQIEKL